MASASRPLRERRIARSEVSALQEGLAERASSTAQSLFRQALLGLALRGLALGGGNDRVAAGDLRQTERRIGPTE
jgi:hypothetical protein